MGKCPNCGQSSIFGAKLHCKICGKESCQKCGIYLFKLWSPQRIILDSWYACSPKCLEELANSIEKEVVPSDFDLLSDLSYAIPVLTKRTLSRVKYQRRISSEASSKENSHAFIVNFAPIEELDHNPRQNRLWQRLLKLNEYHESVQLSNWIKAGRFEDAAIFYEKRGMYEEAGKIRARGREIVVKNTNVNVDLNALLKQIAEGGIVAVYRCPHCGGKLKIGKETKASSLRTCEHCGSEMATMDVADFLRTALS